MEGSATVRAMTSRVMELMVDTPQAKPSSPSIRLTALVMPTIHSTEMGMDSQPSSQKGSELKILGLDSRKIRLPMSTAISAAQICTASFSLAPRA